MQKVCGVCHQRPPQGIATVYWRWPIDQDETVGWRVYYCLSHYQKMMKEWYDLADRAQETDEITCLGCGSALEPEERTWLWAYVYPPKQESEYLSGAHCGACLDATTAAIRAVGFKLEDRMADTRARVDSAWRVFRPAS